MANFTTEAAVRLKMQTADTVAVPSELVTQSIDDAHARILGMLDSAVDVDTPPAELVLGETLLAGAALLRSLASGAAAGGKAIHIGGSRVDTSRRFAALHARAVEAEAAAWDALAAYLVKVPARAPGDASDSTPVLGQGE